MSEREPSFMQPSAPRQNVMQSMGRDPRMGPSMDEIQAKAYADAGVPVGANGQPRRTSVLDIIGGIADTFAELGGQKPQYQATRDARTQRDREAELYPLEVQRAQLNNQKSQQDVMSSQNEVLGRAASLVQRAYQNGGVQGAANMFNYVAPRAGMTPEQIQTERALLEANPEGYIEALNVFASSGKQPEYDIVEVVGPEGKPIKVGVNRNDPSDIREIGAAPERRGSSAVRRMVVDGVPGEYVIGDEGPTKIGDIYEEPRAARACGPRAAAAGPVQDRTRGRFLPPG
jgi:hypothetical protein